MNSAAVSTRFAHADLDGRPAGRLPALAPHPASRSAQNQGLPAERAREDLRRAWSADDAGAADAAVRHRLDAAWAIRQSIRDGATAAGNLAAARALLADVLRRAGEFDAAVGSARRGLAAGPPPAVAALLWFQIDLAGAGDDSRHDLGEALGLAVQ